MPKLGDICPMCATDRSTYRASQPYGEGRLFEFRLRGGTFQDERVPLSCTCTQKKLSNKNLNSHVLGGNFLSRSTSHKSIHGTQCACTRMQARRLYPSIAFSALQRPLDSMHADFKAHCENPAAFLPSSLSLSVQFTTWPRRDGARR